MKRTPHLISLRWGYCVLAVVMLFSLRAKPQSVPPKPVSSVGMIALLANPQNYDGKVIQTIGVLCIEHEGDAIYFQYEDAQHLNDKSALSLRLSDAQRERFKSLNLRYVLIEGVMYANGPESSQFGGAIGNITRLEAWGPTTGIDAPPEKPRPGPRH